MSGWLLVRSQLNDECVYKIVCIRSTGRLLGNWAHYQTNNHRLNLQLILDDICDSVNRSSIRHTYHHSVIQTAFIAHGYTWKNEAMTTWPHNRQQHLVLRRQYLDLIEHSSTTMQNRFIFGRESPWWNNWIPKVLSMVAVVEVAVT